MLGTITTTGKSEAIRLEKSLFRSHPEFRQKSKVQAHVIGHGTMLLSVTDDETSESEVDPIMAAFLKFLDREIAQSPDAHQAAFGNAYRRSARVDEARRGKRRASRFRMM